MLFNTKSKQISYSYDGDFVFKGGALKTSGSKHNEVLKESLYIKLSTIDSDWLSENIITAELVNFLGLDQREENLERLSLSIATALESFGYLEEGDYILSPPVSNGTNLIFSLVVRGLDIKEENIELIFSIDTRDNKMLVKFIDQKAL